MTAWLLNRLASWLFGPGWPLTDDAMDGITLAIQEEAARMRLNDCAS